MSSRRAFLKAASLCAASPLAPAVAQPTHITAVRDSSFDPWVEIDAARLRHNVAEIHRRAGGRPILAVIKNNGYGTGVVNVARAIEPIDAIAGFAVVKLHEAVTLRDAGVTKPILLMGPFASAELRDIAARRIMPMVYTPIGDDIDRLAARSGHPVTLTICIDTGIGRVGVPVRRATPLVRDLATRRSVAIAGTMMTFTEDPEFDGEQLQRFNAFAREIEGDGIKLGRRHAASSFALFQRPEGFLDMVRPGMAIYGIYSEPTFRTAGIMDLRPALSLKARVAYVKQLEAGETAGYERAYRATKTVWIATVPAGHADGIPRAAANTARVRIRGTLYPIVASVSASHCIIEIGGESRVAAGEVATFFDAEDGSRPEDFGAACKTSVYDLIMHLHADLPRRMV